MLDNKNIKTNQFGSAVILAGGQSTRMGFDKQFLEVNGKKLLDMILEKLSQEFEDLILVTNTPEYYKNKKGCFTVVSDEIKGKGPLSGIHIGLKKAKSKYVYLTACDMPNICLSYIKFMKQKIFDNSCNIDAFLYKNNKKIEPFNAFYSRDIFKTVEKHLNKKKYAIFTLLEQLNCFFISEEDLRNNNYTENMFLNLNTKEDILSI